MHEPMKDLIEQATHDVEANGYLNADPASVQLAASGYMIRELSTVIHDGFEGQKKKEKSGVSKVVNRAKVPGAVAALVGIVEIIRASIGF